MTTARDFDPYYWAQVHAKQKRERRAKRLEARKPATVVEEPPFSAEETMAVGVALFGECPTCSALLEVDGSCPFANEHPKHECRDCGALHDQPRDFNHPWLFCRSEAAE